MKPRAYYNEIDEYACNWLCELMANGLIMEGDIDQRSIRDVDPRDLRGYTRVHFFAGIAGWDYALQLAGWPDERPVWTGSCPCQPFSDAGKRGGIEDERHLWPDFFRLVRECRPATIFGEQVASKIGREWLAGIRADLEGLGNRFGAADLCVAGVRAPHIRQRLFWVSDSTGSQARTTKSGDGVRETVARPAIGSSQTGRFVGGDGRTYRIPEPAISFVVDGFPDCVAQISAFGNAINPKLGAEFIKAYTDLV